MLSLAWLVGVAVVVELCVSMLGWHEHEGAQMCILASLQYSWASRASAQSASAWYYWPRSASMLDWLVFGIDVATIRILI